MEKGYRGRDLSNCREIGRMILSMATKNASNSENTIYRTGFFSIVEKINAQGEEEKREGREEEIKGSDRRRR